MNLGQILFDWTHKTSTKKIRALRADWPMTGILPAGSSGKASFQDERLTSFSGKEGKPIRSAGNSPDSTMK
ncbi:hypothetical protein F2P79_005035 [Pimephales promelas]|nr:hypothetical protein F2P79_005035 [Pimephales promelas]